jgi:hypothetical protein
MIMKKPFFALAFLGLAAGASFAAEVNFAGNNQAPYRIGELDVAVQEATVTQEQFLAAPGYESAPQVGDEWLSGRYGMTKNPDDIRRWDEKNSN